MMSVGIIITRAFNKVKGRYSFHPRVDALTGIVRRSIRPLRENPASIIKINNLNSLLGMCASGHHRSDGGEQWSNMAPIPMYTLCTSIDIKCQTENSRR